MIFHLTAEWKNHITVFMAILVSVSKYIARMNNIEHWELPCVLLFSIPSLFFVAQRLVLEQKVKQFFSTSFGVKKKLVIKFCVITMLFAW